MKSYSFGSCFGKDEIPEDVVDLFTDTIQSGGTVKYASEIIFAGMQGRINTECYFNLPAYERAIEENTHLAKSRRKRKEVYIDYCSGDDDVIRTGGVYEEHLVVSDVIDAFEEVCDSDELAYAVSQIKGLNDDLILVEGLDIVEAVRLSLDGLPRALSEVKRICDFYPKIAEYIKIILSSGKSFDDCMALC